MVTGVILAGGKSRRMGQNKAFLRLGNNTLIGHVIRCMRSITDELLLITNNPDEYTHLDIVMHNDIIQNAGTLGGIHSGLTHASHETVICVGCDSPFLKPNLLKYLVSVLENYDAVMPLSNEIDNNTHKTLQTLCAVYSKSCIPIIEDMLKHSELRVHALQESANVLCISPETWNLYDPDGISFFNVNTPEDYIKAQSIYGKLSENLLS